MRVQVLRTAAIAGLIGAVAGVLVALVGNWWAAPDPDQPVYFGYYSFTPLPDVRSAPPELTTNWWQLLWPAAVAGLVVAIVAALLLTVRRGRVRPLPAGWRRFLALGAVGAVLGAAVIGALYVRTETEKVDGHPRRYVDYLQTSDDGAYRSTLTVTFDEQTSQIVALLGVCAGTGLAAGLATAGVITIARRRGMSRGTAGAA